MKIKFVGWISSLAGTREMDVRVDSPVQLKEILPFSLHERNIIVVVNNESRSEETFVNDCDQVVLMPVISGG